MSEERAAVAALDDGYHVLFDRVLDVVRDDPRIRALWLSGSLAKGTADAGSDLDLLIAVGDDDFESYASGWRDWLGSITDPIIARELPGAPGSFTSTNRDCLRLDVVAERVSAVPSTVHRWRLVVLDHDGLDALVPAPDPVPGPDPALLAGLVEEAFRQIAIFPQAIVRREDWLLGAEGIGAQRRLLYDVFVAANQPLPPMGVKQFTAKLRPEQVEVLSALPGVEVTRESVIAGMRATVDAWLTAGRETLEAAGVPWPSDLADPVTAYFTAHTPRLSHTADAAARPAARPEKRQPPRNVPSSDR